MSGSLTPTTSITTNDYMITSVMVLKHELAAFFTRRPFAAYSSDCGEHVRAAVAHALQLTVTSNRLAMVRTRSTRLRAGTANPPTLTRAKASLPSSSIPTKPSSTDTMSVTNKEMRSILKCSDSELTLLKAAFKTQMQDTVVDGKPFLVQMPSDIDANGARRKLMWSTIAGSQKQLGKMLNGERWKDHKPANFEWRLENVKTKIQRDLTASARRRRPDGACVRDEEEVQGDSNVEDSIVPVPDRTLRKRRAATHDISKGPVIDLVSVESDSDVSSPTTRSARKSRAIEAQGRHSVKTAHTAGPGRYVEDVEDGGDEASDNESLVSSTELEMRKRQRVARITENTSMPRSLEGRLSRANRRDALESYIAISSDAPAASEADDDEVADHESALLAKTAQSSSSGIRIPRLKADDLRLDPRFLADPALRPSADRPRPNMARTGWHGIRPDRSGMDNLNASSSSDSESEIVTSKDDRSEYGRTWLDGVTFEDNSGTGSPIDAVQKGSTLADMSHNAPDSRFTGSPKAIEPQNQQRFSPTFSGASGSHRRVSDGDATFVSPADHSTVGSPGPVASAPASDSHESLQDQIQRITTLGMQTGVTRKMISVKEQLPALEDRFGEVGKDVVEELVAALPEAAPAYARASLAGSDRAPEVDKTLDSLTRKIIRFYVADEVARVRSRLEDKLVEMETRLEGLRAEIRREVLAELDLH